MTANIFPSTTEKNLKTLNGTLSYTLNATDVRWIWGILITITAPYLFTILKYFWVLMLQRTWPMQWNTLVVVYFFSNRKRVEFYDIISIVQHSFIFWLQFKFSLFSGTYPWITSHDRVVHFCSSSATKFWSVDSVCRFFLYMPNTWDTKDCISFKRTRRQKQVANSYPCCSRFEYTGFCWSDSINLSLGLLYLLLENQQLSHSHTTSDFVSIFNINFMVGKLHSAVKYREA